MMMTGTIERQEWFSRKLVSAILSLCNEASLYQTQLKIAGTVCVSTESNEVIIAHISENVIRLKEDNSPPANSRPNDGQAQLPVVSIKEERTNFESISRSLRPDVQHPNSRTNFPYLRSQLPAYPHHYMNSSRLPPRSDIGSSRMTSFVNHSIATETHTSSATPNNINAWTENDYHCHTCGMKFRHSSGLALHIDRQECSTVPYIPYVQTLDDYYDSINSNRIRSTSGKEKEINGTENKLPTTTKELVSKEEANMTLDSLIMNIHKFECRDCGYLFDRSSDLAMHMDKRECVPWNGSKGFPSLANKTNSMPRILNGKANGDSHKKSSPKILDSISALTDKDNETPKTVTVHDPTFDNDNKRKCPYCEEHFSNALMLWRHLRDLSCRILPSNIAKTNNVTAGNTFSEIQHSGIPKNAAQHGHLECPYCRIILTNEPSFRYHIWRRRCVVLRNTKTLNLGKHICYLCNRSFSSAGNLQQHKYYKHKKLDTNSTGKYCVVNSPEKPITANLSCKRCKCSCSSVTQRRRHQRRCHKGRYSCSKCGLIFNSYARILYHKRIRHRVQLQPIIYMTDK